MNENIMNALNAIEDERADSTADVMIAMESYTGKTDEFNNFTDSEMVMESSFKEDIAEIDYMKKVGNFIIAKPEDSKEICKEGDLSVIYVDPRADDSDVALSKGMIVYGPESRKTTNAECAIYEHGKPKNMGFEEMFKYIKSKHGLNKKDEADFRAIMSYARKKVNAGSTNKSDSKEIKERED